MAGRPWRPRPDVQGAIEPAVSLVAYALGTALPVGPAVQLAIALFRGRPDEAGAADRRFTEAVAAWAREAGVDDILAADWSDRLREAVEHGVADRDAVSLVAEAVFTPHTTTHLGLERARQAAAGLVAALPDLVLAAADPEFPMLRAVLSADLARVLDRVDELAALVSGPVVGEALVETYRGALARALGSDPWLRLLGRPDQDVDAVFASRRVVHRPASAGAGGADPVELDVAADACDRLVVLGGPGAGKTWAAMHLARRAGPEVPLYVRASAVLDRPPGEPVWEAALRTAVEPLAEVIGLAESAALRRWLDEHGTRFLVVVDGLDEAVHTDDVRALDRLADLPRRQVRIVVTSRPGAWKRQLTLDPARDRLARSDAGGGHAVVDLAPLTGDDVRALVAAAVPDAAPRVQLEEALLHDQRLSDMATTPLLCVMLCALAGRGEGLPLSRSALVSEIVMQLVRSSWRSSEPVPDRVLAAVLGELLRVAREAAADDPATDLGAWPADVAPALTGGPGLDAVLPPVGHDPWAPRQTRRFVHRLVWSELVARELAGRPAAEAASALRHHLWFDDDWDEVVPTVLALHPERSAVLRSLLDADGGDAGQAWARLDGFGELSRLLVTLVERTSAGDWPDPGCAGILAAAAHERIGTAALPLRLVLRQGGWPDNVSREDHLADLALGDSHFAPEDLAAGIATLGLSAAERSSLAARLAALLPRSTAFTVESGAPILDVLCGSDLPGPREATIGALLAQLERTPDARLALAVVALRASPSQRRRAAEVLAAEIGTTAGNLTRVGDRALADARWGETVAATSDDPELRDRTAHLLVEQMTADHTAIALYALAEAVTKLGPPPALRAEAVARLLNVTNRFGSYDTEMVGAGLRRLLPGPEEQVAVLAELIPRSPGAWDGVNFPMVTDMVAAVSRDDRAGAGALAEQVVGAFDEAHLADLERLVDIFLGLVPNADMRDRAARTVAARAARLPGGAVLVGAEPLRRLDPTPEVRSAVVRTLVEFRATEANPYEQVRLAEGILWFAPPGPERLAVVQDIAAGIERATTFLVNDLPAWAPSATPEERAVLAHALTDQLGPGAHLLAWTAANALALVTDGPARLEACAVLLDRLRSSPETPPYDWLLPLATLGAPSSMLSEVNNLVVASLERSELHDGLCSALGTRWERAPLTPAQSSAASAILAARLADPSHDHPRAVAELLCSLDPPPSVLADAGDALRSRLSPSPDYLRSDIVAALRRIEPDFVDPAEPHPADVARAALHERFTLNAARDLARSDPTEATRQEVIAALVEWASTDASSWSLELAEIEVLARELGLVPEDLFPLVGTDEADTEPVRSLARVARRACRGEEWRSFLAGCQ